MSTLYITEYAFAAPLMNGTRLPMGAEPAIAEQEVTIGGTSTQSAPFNANTEFIMVHSDAICSLAFGDNPTAVATKKRMAANTDRYYWVKGVAKLAVIQNS